MRAGLLTCAGLLVTHACAKTSNVLFLLVDDLRPDLGAYNLTYMHTPNFDALAAADDAVIFDSANV